MRITIEIDTENMSDRDEAVLAVLGGAAPLGETDASVAEPRSNTVAGAGAATPTTSERSPRGRRGAKAAEPAASTPASSTSPGDVFSSPAASALTPASSVPTGDVFSQPAKAAAPAGVTKDQIGAKVSQLLPTLKAQGLKEVLSQFTKSDGSPVTVLRDLEEKDFDAFMDQLEALG